MPHSVSLRVSPNNEIRIVRSHYPSPRKGGGDTVDNMRRERYARLVTLAQQQVVEHRHIGVVVNPGGTGFVITKEEVHDYQRRIDQAPLDIRSEFQRGSRRLPERKPGWGVLGRPTRFSRLARLRMLSAAAIAARRNDEFLGQHFVTLTVPGGGDRTNRCVAQFSGYIVNRLAQLRRRRFPSALWLYAWEHQRRGALHLHICVFGNTEAESLAFGEALRLQWYKTLDDISVREGTCLFEHQAGGFCTAKKYWQSDVQKVQKSVACYLSKYLSKATASGSKDKDKGRVAYYPPSRWWGMSRRFCQMVKEETYEAQMQFEHSDTADRVAEAIGNLVRSLAGEAVYDYKIECDASKGGARAFPVSGHVHIFYCPEGSVDRCRVCLQGGIQILLGSGLPSFAQDGVRENIVEFRRVRAAIRETWLEDSEEAADAFPGLIQRLKSLPTGHQAVVQ